MQPGVADGAQCRKIVFDVGSIFGVRLDVVKFQMPWVGRIPFLIRPAAVPAAVTVSTKYRAADRVRNPTVMLGALSARLQNVNPYGRVGAPARLRRDGPTELSA